MPHREPRSGLKAGFLLGKKLSARRQLTLAAAISPFWQREVEDQTTKFPPAADTSPMRCCDADKRNLEHLVPSYYLIPSKPPRQKTVSGARPIHHRKRMECVECVLDRWDRRIRYLRREGLLVGKLQEEEDRHEKLRQKGLPVTHSESAAANMALHNFGGEIVQIEMLPEDLETLRDQVIRYRRLVGDSFDQSAMMQVFGEEAVFQQ
jgi:hypothetical protein